MSDLAEFLLSCADTDEWRAHLLAADDGDALLIARSETSGIVPEDAWDVADPARVLADCAALRAVVGLPVEGLTLDPFEDAAPEIHQQILRILAQPFRGREGWRDEWRA